MDFETTSFRHADVILQEKRYIIEYREIINTLKNISEQDIIDLQNKIKLDPKNKTVSLSIAINSLLRKHLALLNWKCESPIFNDSRYLNKRETTWRLDFAKNLISVEVAFNHGEAIAWNLLKPVLASELNHVKKGIQTEVGIVITATQDMKKAGGFDDAVGPYEKFLRYLQPMQNQLTTPLLIIGLKAPQSFYIAKTKNKQGLPRGTVIIK